MILISTYRHGTLTDCIPVTEIERDLCFGTPVFRLVESAAQPQVPVLRETKFSGAQNVSLPFHVDISPAGRVVVALREGFKRPLLIRGRGGWPTRVMV